MGIAILEKDSPFCMLLANVQMGMRTPRRESLRFGEMMMHLANFLFLHNCRLRNAMCCFLALAQTPLVATGAGAHVTPQPFGWVIMRALCIEKHLG